MHKILVADDDYNIRGLVCTVLKNEGYLVFEAANGQEALTKMAQMQPDACVIDIMMPKMDGFELCKNLRKYYNDMPILMLTALDDISKKVKGFETGADDYLTKPFEPAELIVRVKALLRRYKVPSSDVLNIGKVKIDKANHTIFLESVKLEDIPLKEFELLFKLSKMQGKTIARGDLIDDVWGMDFDGNERTLDVHINRLRARLADLDENIKITAIRGIGYRLEVVK